MSVFVAGVLFLLDGVGLDQASTLGGGGVVSDVRLGDGGHCGSGDFLEKGQRGSSHFCPLPEGG